MADEGRPGGLGGRRRLRGLSPHGRQCAPCGAGERRAPCAAAESAGRCQGLKTMSAPGCETWGGDGGEMAERFWGEMVANLQSKEARAGGWRGGLCSPPWRAAARGAAPPGGGACRSWLCRTRREPAKRGRGRGRGWMSVCMRERERDKWR